MNTTFAVASTAEAAIFIFLFGVFVFGMVFALTLVLVPPRRRHLRFTAVALATMALLSFCGGGVAYLSLQKTDNVAATAASFEEAFAVTLSQEAAEELYSMAMSVERTAPSTLVVTVDGRPLALEVLILPTTEESLQTAYALLPDGVLAPLPVALEKFTPPLATKIFKK